MKRIGLLSLILAVGFATYLIAPKKIPSISSTQSQVVSVAKVIDGDTIELTSGKRVRYIGIDAPEKDACFASESAKENKRLVEGKQVRLVKDVSETDSYGRLLRYVYVDSLFVNKELVGKGFAKATPIKPDTGQAKVLFTTQEKAKETNQGLWKQCSSQ